MFNQLVLLGKKTSKLTVWGVPTAVYTCAGIFNNMIPSCLSTCRKCVHTWNLIITKDQGTDKISLHLTRLHYDEGLFHLLILTGVKNKTILLN